MLLQKFQQFMYGRYGGDKFSLFLLVIALVLSFLGILFWPVTLLADAVFLYVLFRMFSRNTGRRFQENQVYLRWRFYVGEWFRNLKFRIQEGRRYKIFKCPGCGQKIRIPRGHGKIQIRCRKCGREFFGRS